MYKIMHQTKKTYFVYCAFRPHRIHELRTIAIDVPVAFASVRLSYSFARWRHFDAAATTLLWPLVTL